jgi:ABC-type Fe3+/spermidine/putrescine transport system ATPase subunit
MNDAQLEVEDVWKAFDEVAAVRNVTLTASKGEFVTILGPSGSGKSTLLNLIGGQLVPDGGDIRIAGRSVAGLPPEKIDTATVFQSYALFPHLNVYDNIAFGLKMRKVAKQQIQERVTRMIELFSLHGLERRRISQLSGGQMQRVATARALVLNPSVILMDEPLGALDRAIKMRLQIELRSVLETIGATTVYVTHDQAEGLSMADRVAVMNHGVIEQIGPPTEIYRNPATEFVATFVGGANVLDGVVVAGWSEGSEVRCGATVLHCRNAAPIGSKVRIAIRPEDVHLVSAGETLDPSSSSGFRCRVVDLQYFGAYTHYELGLRTTADQDEIIRVTHPSYPLFNEGESIVALVPNAASVVIGSSTSSEVIRQENESEWEAPGPRISAR